MLVYQDLIHSVTKIIEERLAHRDEALIRATTLAVLEEYNIRDAYISRQEMIKTIGKYRYEAMRRSGKIEFFKGEGVNAVVQCKRKAFEDYVERNIPVKKKRRRRNGLNTSRTIDKELVGTE